MALFTPYTMDVGVSDVVFLPVGLRSGLRQALRCSDAWCLKRCSVNQGHHSWYIRFRSMIEQIFAVNWLVHEEGLHKAPLRSVRSHWLARSCGW